MFSCLAYPPACGDLGSYGRPFGRTFLRKCSLVRVTRLPVGTLGRMVGRFRLDCQLCVVPVCRATYSEMDPSLLAGSGAVLGAFG